MKKSYAQTTHIQVQYLANNVLNISHKYTLATQCILCMIILMYAATI